MVISLLMRSRSAWSLIFSFSSIFIATYIQRLKKDKQKVNAWLLAIEIYSNYLLTGWIVRSLFNFAKCTFSLSLPYTNLTNCYISFVLDTFTTILLIRTLLNFQEQNEILAMKLSEDLVSTKTRPFHYHSKFASVWFQDYIYLPQSSVGKVYPVW